MNTGESMNRKVLWLLCILVLATCGGESHNTYQAATMWASFAYPKDWRVSASAGDRDEAFNLLNNRGEPTVAIGLQTVSPDDDSLLEVLEKGLDIVISADGVSQATVTLQPGLIETEYALQARARATVTMNKPLMLSNIPVTVSFDWYFIAIELGNGDIGIMTITNLDWYMRVYERELELIADSFRPTSKPQQ